MYHLKYFIFQLTVKGASVYNFATIRNKINQKSQLNLQIFYLFITKEFIDHHNFIVITNQQVQNECKQKIKQQP